MGKKRIINMLNSTMIDRDYFNKVKDEIVNERIETSELPIEITLLKAMAMVEFAFDMDERLFGKKEDK